VQAEEILKEAISRQPQRIDIHLKLLSVYAKRGDVANFEALVMEAHALTKGKGAEWARICDMGRALDPRSPLYSPSQAADHPGSRGAQISESASATDTDKPSDRANLITQRTSATGLDLNLGPSSSTSNTKPALHQETLNPAADAKAGRTTSVLSPFINRPFVGITPALATPTKSTNTQEAKKSVADGSGDQHPDASADASQESDESLKVDWDALNLDLDLDTPSTPASKTITRP
jgi:pilus assembly protein FimV